MKLSELSEASSFGPSPELHLGLARGVTYSIPRSSVELDTFTPAAFDEFVTPTSAR